MMNEIEFIRVCALAEVESALSCLNRGSAGICRDIDQKKLTSVRTNLQDITRSLYVAVGDLVEGGG